MMFSAARLIKDPIRISDEKVRYLVFLAEVDSLAGALVPHNPDTTFGA
jgi:hypothetical protein